jgi:hypothetical protein
VMNEISYFSLTHKTGYVRGNRIHYGIKRNDHFEKDSIEESDGSEGEEEEEEEEEE